MIAAQFKTPTATVRIHDDYFEAAADGRVRQLGRIVSGAYKRRQMQNNAAAAPNAAEREQET